eukprot:11182386-Lingulodinium_polyedra.AAC.1
MDRRLVELRDSVADLLDQFHLQGRQLREAGREAIEAAAKELRREVEEGQRRQRSELVCAAEERVQERA